MFPLVGPPGSCCERLGDGLHRAGVQSAYTACDVRITKPLKPQLAKGWEQFGEINALVHTAAGNSWTLRSGFGHRPLRRRACFPTGRRRSRSTPVAKFLRRGHTGGERLALVSGVEGFTVLVVGPRARRRLRRCAGIARYSSASSARALRRPPICHRGHTWGLDQAGSTCIDEPRAPWQRHSIRSDRHDSARACYAARRLGTCERGDHRASSANYAECPSNPARIDVDATR